ncbi:MAG: trimethylamine methyltransferase family protein [Alphaproteobacteria bacterium]|nr:trimethylamine methyltransferase family protein [Alphaproteobacteria bacterium]
MGVADDTKETSRRRGGRKARQEMRAAPIPREEAAVKPGMVGGKYQPLSRAEQERIHESALEILETVGISDTIPSGIEYLTSVGCRYENGRMYFPRKVIAETLEKANYRFTLHGRDPVHDIEPCGKKVYFGTAGAAVHIAEPETNTYRESFLHDLYDAARIVDNCEHIHYFQRSVVPRDIEDPRDMDFNTAYASLAGTNKHVGTSMVMPQHVTDVLEMCHMIAGSEEAWRAKPFVSMSCCFVVPPMKWAEDACACLETAILGGMPVLLLSAGQAGATSPAALAGAVVLQVAECLAGLTYVNAISPGAPAIFGPWPFVSDLRTGAMSGGSGEQALLTAACAQMGQFYGLPTGSAAGMCDAEMPDIQAGYEKGLTAALVGASGLNMVYESVGMHASLLGFCLESLLIDNDMIGAINRNVRGIEVNDATLSVDIIREVCLEGPGHFLGSDQTLSLMQTEYVYPELATRMSPKEWNEAGKPDIVKKATARKKEILSTYFPGHIPADVDKAIRDKFNVLLPEESVRPK